MSSGPRRRTLGISLVEALVALAVMAFGTLSVLGVQGTLRLNADVSKQRSEALRIAQLAIETARGVNTLDAYLALADTDAVDVPSETGEVTFSLSQTVTEAPGGVDDDDLPLGIPAVRYKSVVVNVSWTDRTGQAQAVSLSTAVQSHLAVLAASTAVSPAGSPVRTPKGRHRAIPVEATDQGNGTSTFVPPGAGAGVRWTFNNYTGVITRLCDSCDTVQALLLQGFVRFAIQTTQPAAADAEVPPSAATGVGLQVTQTLPPSVPAPSCFSRLELAYVAYYCAVHVAESSSFTWSGRSTLVPSADLVLSTGAEPENHRVCRYTRLVGSPPAPTTVNTDHPDTYSAVGTALLNQNFLVIRAGDGTTAFTCPGDDSTTPLVNGQTWLHQP